LEQQTIQPIPASERHGTARDLFTVWFGSNIMLLTIVTGAIGTTLYGLPFSIAVLCLSVGNLAGGVFMALHAAQGPTLGVPQMVQTRGQFGSIGSLLVVSLVIVMYLGFLASILVLGGQGLHLIANSVSETTGIVGLGLLTVAGAILGYDLIHAYSRILTYASGAVLALAFVWVFLLGHTPLTSTLPHRITLNGVLGTVSVAALWQIAYAPYVSDYSRYLPKETGARTAFWSSYLGCVLGSLPPMILGAAVGLHARNDDVIASLATGTGVIAPVVLVVFSVGMAATSAMNLYCGTLSTLTFGQTLAPDWSPKAGARAVVAGILFCVSLGMALFTKDSFLVDYNNFISLLLYVLVPWTAINLVDYYFVQHGAYDIDSFLRQDGGIYGRINGPATFCYAFGILVQIPFMATALFTGPVARWLGGADIAWIVGLALTGPVYILLAKRIPLTVNVEGQV
jgi:nucleobase:cation symporter-1, NCS1 family